MILSEVSMAICIQKSTSLFNCNTVPPPKALFEVSNDNFLPFYFKLSWCSLAFVLKSRIIHSFKVIGEVLFEKVFQDCKEIYTAEMVKVSSHLKSNKNNVTVESWYLINLTSVKITIFCSIKCTNFVFREGNKKQQKNVNSSHKSDHNFSF